MALEDIIVLDAWAVWPQKSVGGDLKGLQILDGSTIKPLIDDRGMRPTPPYPAFQQILFGFPRSEFSAPDEGVEADGEFSSDEMSFMIRNRRSNSVYGFSEVERALPIADIYLRRQQWLRAEYTDGVIPELLLKSDGSFTPDQLRAYENVLNDYLAGQTEQRKRANILPGGLDPISMDGYGEKFKSTLDDFLVTAICGHFGVQPSEIGMAQSAGLGGGAGLQNGQASSSEVIGLVPLANWIGKMISQLSYVYLGMPRELEFKFMPSARNDEEGMARTIDVAVKNGTMTRNEARAKQGLPLLDAPEADLPIIETAAGTFVITNEGLEPLAPAEEPTEEAVTAEGDTDQATTVDDGSPVENPERITDDTPDEKASPDEEEELPLRPGPKKPVDVDDKANAPVDDEEDEPTKKSVASDEAFRKQRDEIRQFKKWLRKSPNKPFNFEYLPEAYASTLNKFVAVQEYDNARWFINEYL
jgi:hypothetical protein